MALLSELITERLRAAEVLLRVDADADPASVLFPFDRPLAIGLGYLSKGDSSFPRLGIQTPPGWRNVLADLQLRKGGVDFLTDLRTEIRDVIGTTRLVSEAIVSDDDWIVFDVDAAHDWSPEELKLVQRVLDKWTSKINRDSRAMRAQIEGMRRQRHNVRVEVGAPARANTDPDLGNSVPSASQSKPPTQYVGPVGIPSAEALSSGGGYRVAGPVSSSVADDLLAVIEQRLQDLLDSKRLDSVATEIVAGILPLFGPVRKLLAREYSTNDEANSARVGVGFRLGSIVQGIKSMTLASVLMATAATVGMLADGQQLLGTDVAQEEREMKYQIAQVCNVLNINIPDEIVLAE